MRTFAEQDNQQHVKKPLLRLSSGFTFLEVMLVLCIFAIVLAAAVPSLNSSLDEMKLDSAAQEVVAAIQYAQSLAIKKNKLHGVKFWPSLEKYHCYESVPGNVIYDPVSKKLYTIDFTVNGHMQGIDIVSSTFSGAKVEFSSLGEPSAAGNIVLGYGDFQKTVNVSASIGKVTVQ